MNARILNTYTTIASAVLVFALSACSGPQNARTETPIVSVSLPGSSAASPPPPDDDNRKPYSMRAKEKPNRCLAAGPFPALPEVSKPVDLLPCRPAEKKAQKEAADLIRKRYAPERPGSTVEVHFDCDGLDKTITKIEFESGGGHASMSMVRIERTDPAAPMYDVKGISVPGGLIRPNPPINYSLLEGLVSADAVALKMPSIRAALVAKIKEVGGSTNSGRGFGSSSSTHLVVRIEDAASRVMEGRYTGPVMSNDQDKRVPVEAAMEFIQSIVAAPVWVNNAPVRDEHKQFFVQLFVAHSPHFEDQWAWWVGERFVKLSAYMGTKALVPSLLHLLKNPDRDDASAMRTRDLAVEALVALTGWEPRAPTPGSGEKPRSNAEAANDFLEQCGKVTVTPGP